MHVYDGTAVRITVVVSVGSLLLCAILDMSCVFSRVAFTMVLSCALLRLFLFVLAMRVA